MRAHASLASMKNATDEIHPDGVGIQKRTRFRIPILKENVLSGEWERREYGSS